MINNDIHTFLCFNHLDDTRTYKMIDFNPQFELFNTTFKLLSSLKENNHISQKLYNCFYRNIHYKKLPNF